jgi:hypothetical protein
LQVAHFLLVCGDSSQPVGVVITEAPYAAGIPVIAVVTLKNRTLSPVVERFIECAREVTRPMREGRHSPFKGH